MNQPPSQWKGPVPDHLAVLLSGKAASASGASTLPAAPGPRLPELLDQPQLADGQRTIAPNLLAFWTIWESMDQRGGFYVRKPLWQWGSRFLVAAVVEHRDHPGQRAVLGRFVTKEDGRCRNARLTEGLDQPLWLFAGVTARRRLEDGASL